MFILKLLFGLAVVGTFTSTIFLLLTIAGYVRFKRQARRAKEKFAKIRDFPAVSVLKPVHGLEAQLKENIESFFQQDYPAYEILFAAEGGDDPALEVVREVSARYPKISTQILLTGKPPWANPPAFAFYRMAEVARYEILVTSDSDVEVLPNYLRDVVAAMLEPKVGMVTCVYRGKNAAGFWSGLTAIGMSVEMTAGVLVANLMEGIKFGLGPTIAVSKKALKSIGGFEAVGEYFANDFVIGNFIDKAGYRVLLSHHTINHVVEQKTFKKMWISQLRWATSTRYSRPVGHLGTGLIFAMPFGLLGLVTGIMLNRPMWGVAMLAAAVLNRVLESVMVGWEVVRDPVALKKFWLYPLRDLLGFAVWVASFVNAQTVWRDTEYELKGDKIVLRKGSAATPSTGH
ncbi:MAG TPA: bacteriohopanetetrol glucosamine biosynthesis glycosyltransferase HpnI [Candidatus Acidoferrum sp.]